MSYEKVAIEIYVIVRPKYLNEPAVGIYKELSGYLLRYSHILSGYPLSFEIEGVTETGKILEDGSIYVNCLITFCVFGVARGSVLQAVDGYVCCVFPVIVDGNDSYTGDFVVKAIEDERLEGCELKITDDSDF